MQRWLFALSFLIGALAKPCMSRAEKCAPISPDTATSLAEYVHDKFSFPAATSAMSGGSSPSISQRAPSRQEALLKPR
jgi:hypothetical protein